MATVRSTPATSLKPSGSRWVPSLLAAIPREDRAATEHELFTERLTAAIEEDTAIGFNWRLAIMMLSRSAAA